jgi:hypothetical protein
MIMPRKEAKNPGAVEGVWDEVFTGLDHPKTVRKAERVTLPEDVANALVKAGACRRV